jgi:hypothetical protein
MAEYMTAGFLRANDGSVSVAFDGNRYHLANINSLSAQLDVTVATVNRLGYKFALHAATLGSITGTMNINIDTNMWDRVVQRFHDQQVMPWFSIMCTTKKYAMYSQAYDNLFPSDQIGDGTETSSRVVELKGVQFSTFPVFSLNVDAGDGFVNQDMAFVASSISYNKLGGKAWEPFDKK